MCVIICKPANKAISDLDVMNAHRVNPDGFGYMYYDPALDEIVARKEVFEKGEPILKMIRPLQDKEVVFHFRFKTHGEISNAACHPFRVTDKTRHGMTIYVMHNGTITDMVGKPTESDTQIFVNNYLHNTLKHNPMLIEEPGFQARIEAKIGQGNKLCFMYGNGKILRLNEATWKTHETMRCSNKNFYDTDSQKNLLATWDDACRRKDEADRMRPAVAPGHQRRSSRRIDASCQLVYRVQINKHQIEKGCAAWLTTAGRYLHRM